MNETRDRSGARRILTTSELRERFAAVIAAAGRARPADPARRVELAEEALALAESLDDDRARARAHGEIGLGHLALARLDRALVHLAKAERIHRKAGDEGESAEMLLAIGSARRRLGEHAAAVAAYTACRDQASAAADPELTAIAGSALGNVYSEMGEHAVALRHHHEALAVRERNGAGDPRMLAIACSDLGVGYVRLGELEKAEGFFERALEIARREGDRLLEAFVVGNIGAVHGARGDPERARDFAMRSMVIHEELGDRRGMGEAMLAMAAAEERIGSWEEAANLYRGAARAAVMLEDDALHATALAGLGSVLVGAGEGWKGVPELAAALELAERAGDRPLRERLHELLARACEELGESGEALRHFKAAAALRGGLRRAEMRREVAELEARGEVERKERELDRERQATDALRSELDGRVRELTAMAIGMVRKEETLRALRERLREGTDAPEERDGLIATIDDQPGGEEAWKEFERKLDVVHPDFMRRLGRSCPRLTPMEIRICALLRCDMSTKQVAGILHLSERTVENHRYRLRKKLDLAVDTNLVLFLSRL